MSVPQVTQSSLALTKDYTMHLILRKTPDPNPSLPFLHAPGPTTRLECTRKPPFRFLSLVPYISRYTMSRFAVDPILQDVNEAEPR
jgi:hypothetical protein